LINEQLCLIITVDKQGKPDVAPKGTMKVFSDDELIYAEIFRGATLKNILDNPEAVSNCGR